GAGATVSLMSEAGTCDESCQRWVSACVLARTNAYGVHVELSMSVPDSAPQAVKNAFHQGPNGPTERQPCPLGDEADPTCGYATREGAYYGNIFGTPPVDASGQPTAPPPPVPPATGFTGPPTGLVANTPQFFACAGPDSNIPE